MSTHHTITATELAEDVPGILGRVRDQGDSFTVEQDGTAVAAIAPTPRREAVSFHELLDRLIALDDPDETFADDVAAARAGQGMPRLVDWPS